jgi:LPS-assembly protein
VFFRTTTYYTGWKDYQPGLLLDGNTKAGVLVGPALRYDDTKGILESVMKGDLQGGWINDNSDRGTDNYGNPIANDRWFLVWDHKQKISDTIELTSSLNYWSDTSVLRDFRSHLFDKNQQPDSFLELVYPDNYFYASVFTRYRPNDYQDVVQRLPELRFDLNPTEIFDTGINQRLNLAFAFLEERSSPENPALPGGAAELESPRFDAYYGWTRPMKVADWLTFTPVAGVRSTTYFDTNDTNNPYTRVLPQLGFDLQLLAQGQWDYDNALWEIRGLRHQIRPVVQYRWIPAADKGLSHIPSIDRYAFTPYPPPIDLSQKRYADDLWEQQVLRIGIENLFQTRAEDYGSRDLAWLNIYQDFRDSDRAGTRTLSNTYTQFGISPAYWLTLEIYNRFNPYDWDATEFSSRITVHDGDRWRFWFGTQYISDVNETNQYYWGGEYQINSDYSIRAQWRYDSEVSKLTEQFYGLRQRLGHTWTIEYVLGYRENAREDSDFSFGVNLRMDAF